MASAQEAEQIIQSLSGHSALLGKHVEESAKTLLIELLRYTNGKTFTKAKAAEKMPNIFFKIYPDRIVADCNSDDLTKEDLQTICRLVNKEQMKGANFKTIVAATKRTHIQSGNFSFEFQHNIFDIDNNDIMRPVWVNPTQTVPENVTRITLYLHDQGSKEEIQNLKEIIISQFASFDQETILFLKDIQSLRIESREDVKMLRSKHFEKEFIDQYRVSVKVTTIERKNSEEHTCTQLYHVTANSQSSDDLSMKLVLAFPLTNDFKVEPEPNGEKIMNIVIPDETLVESQIYTDADTDDGDYEIITTTDNNFDLQHEAATLFIKAILQFCEHPTLRYYWPRFLSVGAKDPDPFWTTLHGDIRNWISQNPVFVSRHMKHWRLIGHLAIPGPDAQDNAGNPLLDDKISDPFLSANYPPGVADILKDYGLATLTSTQCVDLLEMHFNNPSLRWRTIGRSKEWHGSLARLLSKLLANGNYSDRLKSLPLLQIKDSSMVSTASEPVYFPVTGGIDIAKLGVRVIKESANHGAYSKDLYQQLGVVEASVPLVRDMIVENLSSPKSFSLADTNSYLGYLYLTHQSSNPEHEQHYRAMRIMTRESKLISPWKEIIYFPGVEHPFTPQSLLGIGDASHAQEDPAHYLHPETLNYSPKHDKLFHLSWKTWLCDCLGINKRLSLIRQKSLLEKESGEGVSSTDSETHVLSEQCEYVLKKFPDKFLGLVRYLWVFDGPLITGSPSLLSQIRLLPAKNLCGLDRPVKLQNTWAPLDGLKAVVKHYMENADKFPFLKLDEAKGPNPTVTTNWGFLTKHVGVKSDYGMDFLLEILKSIKHSCKALSSWQMERVFELYYRIRVRLLTCTGDEKQLALDFFEDSGILYMDKTGPIWTGISSCLWAAPPNMISRYPLKAFYLDILRDGKTLEVLSDLFHETLSIRDATLEDMLEELRLLRDENCEDVALVGNIYKYLDSDMEASSEMRTAFGEQDVILIYESGESLWCTTSECFWCEAETSRVECRLETCYPDLKRFFLEKVGVNVSAYDRLLKSTSANASEVKDNMLSFLLEADGHFHRYPLEPMQKAKIFPVEHPTTAGQPPSPVELWPSDAQFHIGDRESLRTSLQSNIRMLTFDVTEVRRLQPFFKWLSMEHRYLSRCVRQTLNVIPSCISEEWDLGAKAYHIARVAETFNCYGSCNDALSLYQRLRTMKIAKVDCISVSLEVIQDGRPIQSQSSQNTPAHISDRDGNLTIYVDYDENNKQLCLFSVLPRKLQRWLMQDKWRSYSGVDFEVNNALTSIFASDAAILDEVLEDQGIAKVSFESHDIVESKVDEEVHQVKENEPIALAIRER